MDSIIQTQIEARLERKPYISDLTDAEWVKIAPLLSPEKAVGRARGVGLREVFNAIYYRADHGAKCHH